VSTSAGALPYVKDGRLRPLAVTMPKRLSVRPEVPTLSETVMAGMEMSAWQGVVVPTGTPEPIVRRLNAELLKVLLHDETRAKLIAQGTEILGSTPEAYAAYLKSELARWSKVVAETGAKVAGRGTRSRSALRRARVGRGRPDRGSSRRLAT